MKVLVIGGGGREHALAWKLAQGERVSQVFVAPGNGGTQLDPRLVNLPLTEPQALADFAASQQVALTVVGPEAPLAAGVVDLFRERSLRIFGPTRAAAQLESSKAFAKAFMQRHQIPTAAWSAFTDAALAKAYVQALAERTGYPVVIKADGLAAGKGVVVAQSQAEAFEAIADMLGANTLGVKHVAGLARVVIEEFMAGEEASFIVLAHGQQVLALATSQDHKRIGEGDTGPNTGGMGAYSPAPVVTPNVHAKVMQEIINPTLAGMAAEGTPFSGFLYAGLMIDAQGRPRTVEFNARLGDPEAQPILMRMKSDLFELLMKACDGQLDQCKIEWDRRTALGVVMAAAGYPAQPRTGDAIQGLIANEASANPPSALPENVVQVFHAATRLDQGQLKTTGGRVLCVTALGDSPRLAQQRALAVVRSIQFDGAQWRNDIGHRAIRN